MDRLGQRSWRRRHSRGETASGWQQVTFASPVPINANTTYVASYFAPAGHTAQDDSYFYPNPSPTPDASSIVNSPPLHALRNSGGTVERGVRDHRGQRLPGGQHGARNYWVDVTFTPRTARGHRPGRAGERDRDTRQRVRGRELVPSRPTAAARSPSTPSRPTSARAPRRRDRDRDPAGDLRHDRD